MLSFTWNGKQYSFVGAPYGVKIMSNVFQRTMSSLLADLPFVRVYIDNITVASRSWKEHERHVEILMQRLNDLNLKISRKKLKIGRRSIRLLGHEISAQGIRADPVKVAQVMSWPFPSDFKSMQSFMGVINYLGPYLHHLADMSHVLNRARVSQEAYDREVAQNRDGLVNAFVQLKGAIANLPLLRFPDFDRPFHVATDASRVGVGAVLYQPTLDQERVGDTSITSENIVAIRSHTLARYERNYPAFKLELLAVVRALKEFHCFLHGRTFTLHTDHRALVHVLDSAKVAPIPSTLADWVQQILSYDFSVEHVPGLCNLLPDHLSRLYSRSDAWGVSNVVASQRASAAGVAKGVGADAEEQSPAVASTGSSSSSSSGSVPTSGFVTASSAVTLPFLAPLALDTASTNTREELMKLLGKRIPAESDRVRIIREIHAMGHYGVRAVVERIYNDHCLWWPGMRDQVAKELAGCATCQKYNSQKRGYHPPRSPDVSLPGDWWQVDLIHMNTSANGFNYILTVVDLFSSFALTRALVTASAEEVATHLYTLMSDWGPPKILQSDGGMEFVNKVVRELTRVSGVELRISTPHYKHSTGSVERLNRTLASSLVKMLDGALAVWDTMLPLVQYYYNTTVRSITGSSPYALMLTRGYNSFSVGEEPLLFDDFSLDDWLNSNDYDSWIDEHHDRLLKRMQDHKEMVTLVYPAIKDRVEAVRARDNSRFESRHRIVKSLEIGDYVMYEDPVRKHKRDQRFVGPYKVKEITPTNTYVLESSLGDEIRAPMSLLKPIPAPVHKDEEVFVIEKIVAHRGKGDTIKYLVKWRNYPSSANSWEPIENFDDQRAITEYWSRRAPPRTTKAQMRKKAKQLDTRQAESVPAVPVVERSLFTRSGRHVRKTKRHA
jgi:transposase InsO family protein